MAGGECRVFERPQYQVLGKAAYDQRWVDGNIEAGVAGCGWKRPAARPENLAPSTTIAKPPPVKRKTIRARVRSIISPAPEVAPGVPWPPVAPRPVEIDPPKPQVTSGPPDILDEPPIRRR